MKFLLILNDAPYGIEQRNTCPVELQERQPTKDHAEVHDEENDDDGCCHGCRAC